MNAAAIQGYTQRAAHDSVAAHLMAIIPDTFVSAFANGDLLQVLLLAVLTGFTLGQELTILLVAMLTSAGASGVTGAGFITLAATLSVIPDIRIAALAILIGIDKFMSEVRAQTNLVGNDVACLAISRWKGELDPVELHHAMGGKRIAGAGPQPGPRRPVAGAGGEPRALRTPPARLDRSLISLPCAVLAGGCCSCPAACATGRRRWCG
jgi:Na+/H+-dicarboxylate symporter